MSSTFQSLPGYLKKYCVEQDYDAYSAMDHATWRFIMRQNREYFRNTAVPVYEKGLQLTGIPVDRIPRISEMDEKLRSFGWGAVAVNGFIPPAAFLEFQARGVLAIACDMRTVEHLEYTPAPDIVHEAAGHAPVLADPEYAEYLRRYARMAQKAIFSQEDIDVYEAIRFLSDIKENPDADAKQKAQAEARFLSTTKSITHVSEATKVGRMAWWTVEYGLVGPLQSPKIFGAGLLSSVGESQSCLKDAVEKRPLTIECVEQTYDITKPQPQLFVAKDMSQLSDVLGELEKTMSFVLGGPEAMSRALQSQMVNTVILDSGLEISGVLETYKYRGEKTLEFLRFRGPVQLGFSGNQLLGHGRNRHPEGFSSPLGNFEGATSKPTHLLSDDELARLGIIRGRTVSLKFTTGYQLQGIVGGWVRREGNLVLINFRRATVRLGDAILFDPAWGEFDLAIGGAAVSVHGGPSNRDDFGEYEVGIASTKPGRTSAYSDEEWAVFNVFASIRNLRQQVSSINPDASNLEKWKTAYLQIVQNAQALEPMHWLATLETIELGQLLESKFPNLISNTINLQQMAESLRNEANRTLPETMQVLLEKNLRAYG